ncbi:hypothetical protein [Rhodanobacter lindaniclasticus]
MKKLALRAQATKPGDTVGTRIGQHIQRIGDQSHRLGDQTLQ